jgi:predicted nucleic acid-binding Zn finger protein
LTIDDNFSSLVFPSKVHKIFLVDKSTNEILRSYFCSCPIEAKTIAENWREELKNRTELEVVYLCFT